MTTAEWAKANHDVTVIDADATRHLVHDLKHTELFEEIGVSVMESLQRAITEPGVVGRDVGPRIERAIGRHCGV